MKAALGIAALAALAGCLQPALETCGDVTCPIGLRCAVVSGGARCVTEDALTSCAGAADLAPCPLGVCLDGVCVGAACGNGRVELDEQCDDGNTEPGDGCSPACTRESCGNAITDDGEQCDCGTGATPRPECNGRPNSDTDPLASCREDCTLHRCGDGILDPSEQCDGGVGAGTTCETFGFYPGGSLACSPICTLDTSGCTGGRCGDGVLQLGEYCDPSVSNAAPGYCVDFGYSTGPVGCSPSCGPALAACRDATVYTQLLPARNDLRDIQPGPTADTIWVGADHELMLYAANHVTSASFAPAQLVDLSSAGTHVAVATNDGKLVLYDAQLAPTDLAAPLPCAQVVMVSDTQLACIGATGVGWWSGGAWTMVPAPVSGWGTPRDAILSLSGAAVLVTDASTIFLAGTTSVAEMFGTTLGVTHLDATPGGYYGGSSYGGYVYGGSYGYSFEGITLAPSGQGSWLPYQPVRMAYGAASVGGVSMIDVDLAWEVAVAGSGPTQRVTGSLDGGRSIDCERMISQGASAMCFSSRRRLYRWSGASIGQPQTVPLLAQNDLSDAYIDENDTAYFIGHSGTGSRWPQATSWQPGGSDLFDTIVGRSSTAIALLGRHASQRTAIALWNGTAWTSGLAPFSYTITAAAPDLVSGQVVLSVVAPSGCELARGAPNALAIVRGLSSCPSSIWVSPTGHTWGVSPTEILDITAGTAHQLPMSAGATAIDGLDDTHIWVAAGPSIYFYDGTTWTAQITDVSFVFDWVSARSADLAIASAGGVTWVWDAAHRWTKLRLPSDPTPLVHPFLRPWGVWYRTQAATVQYAVWQQAWP